MSVVVMNALVTQLALVAPGRVVTREWLHQDDRRDSDLLSGVFTVMAHTEQDFANYPGRAAQLGKQRVFIVAQILLPESATGVQVEDAEFALIDELKALAQLVPMPDVLSGLQLLSVQGSAQLETPNGWVSSVWSV